MAPATHSEPIAVIGSSCRFPGGSDSPSKLWELLRQPRDILNEFPKDRLNLDRFYHPKGETHGSTDVKNKCYRLSEDTRLFDAEFFGISPAEAEVMDPQQRVLLETVYETFESAGCTLEKMRASLTSVHVGIMNADYSDIQLRDTETLPQYNATGTARSILSNRISYVFDLKGASVTIDTACSSSLVALHYAVQGLRNGDCEMAIAAGANLIFDPASFITESKLHMLSPDSKSRMWDESADGYARGEGVAAVLLKPLSKALREGDSIEGIIRETCVNSDGRSQGITMPHATAQAALIRSTYYRAGLDPVKDRCQYFECHGTGTPAGDPVEARAIAEALCDEASADHPLYVGSIKTVLGHTEGCAGLAGVMKVLLAIKHRTIPPNIHFNQLNPAIAPYYASVNSFGFGGTNAHVIVESYDSHEQSSTQLLPAEVVNARLVGALILSAASGPSLLQNIRALSLHITQQPSLNLGDLGWLFQTRRSTHKFRTCFNADSREGLPTAMDTFVHKQQQANPGDSIGIQPQLIDANEIPGVLGVFTGQGAQWPGMGRHLLRSCPLFRKTIEQCQVVLHALHDGPEWSLVQELMAEHTTSSFSTAAISQPLCTAVQLGLVDVLSEAGIRFDAVVGHSSGEIAATYAAGIIDVAGAMQIAYYRGMYAKLARGPKGQQGGMMALGISIHDATEFCSRPEFLGRLSVAANNAPQSVTLSGDSDAINEAKLYFAAQNTFARILKVDTAYHSHHMQPCAEPYLQSLLACDILVRPPRDNCNWNSSVRGDTELLEGDLSSLKGPYWVSNMLNIVLFSQALESSIWHGGPFDVVLEVGPHPALRSPTEQTFKAALGTLTRYSGVLKRGGNDVEALWDALGFIWMHLGPSFVDFEGYRAAFFEGTAPRPKVIKDLPSYAWAHDKIYWRESRLSRKYRTGTDTPHELLGRRTPDDSDHELRWRNILKLSELPWLRGHEVLGEVLMPAAGCVSIAVEAGRVIAAGRPVRLFEVLDLELQRPLVVPDSKEGVETLFTVTMKPSCDDSVQQAQFAYYACTDERAGSLVLIGRGRIKVWFGEGSVGELPERAMVSQNLVRLDVDQVYSVLGDLGLKYQGLFSGISEASRSLGYACASGVWSEPDRGRDYAVHPALLDVAFQTIFFALAHPGSGQITSALLPIRIERVTVNPCVSTADKAGRLAANMESFVTEKSITSLVGDVHIYDMITGHMAVQVEGLVLQAVSQEETTKDRHMFSATVWNTDVSLGMVLPERDVAEDEAVLGLAVAIDRVAMFYMKRLLETIPPNRRTGLQWYHQCMFDAFETLIQNIRDDQHPLLRKEWLSDDYSVVKELVSKYPGQVDFQLTQAVGENIAAVVRGEVQLLEVMLKDDMLNRFYMEGSAFNVMNEGIKSIVQQITHKFPRCNILEIGAGTGGTTWTILNSIGNSYQSYTYTDVSTGFFEKAAQKFSKFANGMIFKALDAEREVAPQGFIEHSYDVVVAAYVLHVSRSLRKTVEHARSLLKPGGFLILLEITAPQVLRFNFMMGGLPGWWLGADDGRRMYPGISVAEWDTLLLETGFSGVDSVIHDVADEIKHGNSLMVSQAVDETMLKLREPLMSMGTVPLDSLLVVGGAKLTTSNMLSELCKCFPTAWKRSLQTVVDIDAVDTARLTPGVDVICFQELDSPLFATQMTDTRLKKLQSIVMNARNIVWVITEEAITNVFLGISRALVQELPHLNHQVVRLEPSRGPSILAKTTLEAFVRLKVTEVHQKELGKALWFQEPELVFSNGECLIPRVMPNAAANELYNASRKVITRPVDTNEVAVAFRTTEENLTLTTASDMITESADSVQVNTKYSLYIPGQGPDDFHLCCGHAETTESAVITVSRVNASASRVPESELLLIDNRECTPAILLAMVNHLFARSIAQLSETSPGRILVYEAEESLATMISAELGQRRVEVDFVTSKSEAPEGWIRIHPRESARNIRPLISRSAGLYIDCTSLQAASPNTALERCLASECRIRRLDVQLLRGLFAAAAGVRSVLESSYSYVTASLGSMEATALPLSSCRIWKAGELTGAEVSTTQRQMYMTSWEDKEGLRLTLQPPDASRCFSNSKTYLMVGMAGGLGLSICQWMIRHGARHMVITSRKPKIDTIWLEEARREGANIRVLSTDVSDRTSVESAINLIRMEMPPIGGVCNAAMVLSDRLFTNMNADQLNNTLAPKVDGTENLNNVLADTPLDFFILLSSSASVIGNPGQSNYHAANLFMAGLAAQRRRRGLAASVIHIDLVIDVGYVTRQDRTFDGQLRSQFFLPVSETDVHHAFAEAIAAGKPDSNEPFELIMGIQPFTEPVEPERRPVWVLNPRFSHFLPPAAAQQARRRNASSGNIQQQVEEADSEEVALAAVLKACSAKLESVLQLAPGSVDVSTPLVDLGIDSLVAVEIRTWFLKELSADVPMMKILGGDSVVQICTNATRKALARLAETEQGQAESLGVHDTQDVHVVGQSISADTD